MIEKENIFAEIRSELDVLKQKSKRRQEDIAERNERILNTSQQIDLVLSQAGLKI